MTLFPGILLYFSQYKSFIQINNIISSIFYLLRLHIRHTQIFDDKKTTYVLSILPWTSTDGRTLPDRIFKVGCRKTKAEFGQDWGGKYFKMTVK